MNNIFKLETCQIGSLRLPSFSISRGDWVVLNWPLKFGGDLETRFYAMLCDPIGSQFSSMTRVCIAFPIGRLAGGQTRNIKSFGDCLAKLPDAERRILINYIAGSRIAKSTPISHLPLTIRSLAGIMLGSTDAGLVVFNTAGLDPLGVQNVYAYVSTKLRDGLGFLELEFPSNHASHTRPASVLLLRVDDLLKRVNI